MPMDLKLKAKIRAELFRCAMADELITYGDFYKRVTGKRMPRHFTALTGYLNQIAMEERSHNYPDITFLVHFSGGTKFPGQIDFRPVKNGQLDKKQQSHLRKGMKEIRKLYCPSTKKKWHY
jgi:hypothetical protein